MIAQEDYLVIHKLHGLGYTITQIARELGLDRKTVRSHLQREHPPRYARGPRPSKLDPYRTWIRTPNGVSTFRTLKTRSGRAPSIARGRWCSSRPTTIIGLRLAYLNAVSLHRATTSIDARLCFTSPQRGFKQFTG